MVQRLTTKGIAGGCARWSRCAVMSWAGVAGALVLFAAAGCSTDGGVQMVSKESLRDKHARLPAVKPAGVQLVRSEKDWETGPPPYGYIKIIGEPVPNWKPPHDDFETRYAPLAWTFIGPKPMSSEYWSGEGNAGGHINAIAPHPTDANTVYIAADSGGVWKTTDGGTNWVPLTDQLSIMNHGALAIDPQNPNTVYAGTGAYQSGSSGDGIFRSLDAGATWNQIATVAQVGNQITEIVVHPTNSNTIHVTGSSGYYRSLDGGTSWSQRLSGACTGLEIHPTTPDTLYVGRVSQGVYRSINGGTSLTKLAGGLPLSGFGTVVMDISKSNPLVLYAGLINGGSLQGLYRTADGGTTWTKKTATPNFPSPQGDWNAYVGVDPTNENIAYCGGVDSRYAVAGIIKTTDGGDTWAEKAATAPTVHPDHHCIAFGPTGTVWEGNDGGIYKSTNGGNTWSNMNSTLAVGQIYNIVVHPTSLNRALGGTQDNGTPEKTGSSTTWPQLQVGDGGFSVIDSSVTTRRYTTYVYLDITRWSNSSGTGITGPWGSDSTNFIAPLVGDPNSTTTLLGGTNRIWRTTNSTAGTPTWTAISTTTVAGGGTINAIAVAKNASSVIYSGSSTGKVYVTTNASTWNNRSTGLPAGEISDIVVSPYQQGSAYVSFYNTTGARVLKTVDYGMNWTNVTGTLPSGARANALAVDFDSTPEAMYVGAGAGLYMSLDGGATWIKNDSSLPNVNVADLNMDLTNRILTAGTYGRGAWKTTLPPKCRSDYNGDGFVTGDDFDAFVLAFELGSPSADFNLDGFVSGDDYDAYVVAFEAGC